MNDFQIWILFGRFRIAEVARALGCTRQNIVNFERKGVDFIIPQELAAAMNKVETLEMRSSNSCQYNILRAAALTAHPDDRVRKKANFSLIVWSEIYANLPGIKNEFKSMGD